MRWRHLSAVTDDNDSRVFAVERIRADDLFDLSVDLKVNENLDFSMGVNNITNRQPVQLGSNQSGANTYPQTFDVLGRDFFFSGTIHF